LIALDPPPGPDAPYAIRTPDGTARAAHVQVRCTVEFSEWLDRFAAFLRCSRSDAVERALALYAGGATEGVFPLFDPPPPR
jgi:hypothetical protein